MSPRVTAAVLFPLFAARTAAAQTTDDALLRPAPSRVRVVVESVGPRQPVGTVASGGDASAPRLVCTTPCTLYVPPGPFTLFTGGGDVRAVTTALDVPATGLRLRMRAPSEDSVTRLDLLRFGATVATVAGFGALLLGLTLPTDSATVPLEVTGTAVLGAGIALLVTYFVVDENNAPGVASSEPLARARQRPEWFLGAAPAAGGLSLSGTLRF